jgi:hypothetical protein
MISGQDLKKGATFGKFNPQTSDKICCIFRILEKMEVNVTVPESLLYLKISNGSIRSQILHIFY